MTGAAALLVLFNTDTSLRASFNRLTSPWLHTSLWIYSDHIESH
jgi:hypothetical protein